MEFQTLLITGGCGYIGSHTCIALVKSYPKIKIIIVDSQTQCSPQTPKSLTALLGDTICIIKGDINDKTLLQEIFKNNKIDGVIHFAGFKSANESTKKPEKYYFNNISGSLNLFNVMTENNVKKIIFSSSAAVYSPHEKSPINELASRHPNTPYAHTKIIIEDVLENLSITDKNWHASSLRYFNPIGAHDSGLIGENPLSEPENLAPLIMQVAIGKRESVTVYGSDYPTRDGTGIRDYIHVMDLAMGHVKALEYIQNNPGHSVFNLGTGNGHSVLEVIRAFEVITNKRLPTVFAPRRNGDLAEVWADPTLANSKLNWVAEHDLLTMCNDAWKFELKKNFEMPVKN